jgi:hypothetical protein
VYIPVGKDHIEYVNVLALVRTAHYNGVRHNRYGFYGMMYPVSAHTPNRVGRLCITVVHPVYSGRHLSDGECKSATRITTTNPRFIDNRRGFSSIPGVALNLGKLFPYLTIPRNLLSSVVTTTIRYVVYSHTPCILLRKS